MGKGGLVVGKDRIDLHWLVMITLLVLAQMVWTSDANASLEDSLFASENQVKSDSIPILPMGRSVASGASSNDAATSKSLGMSGQIQTSWRTRLVRDDLPADLSRYVEAFVSQEFETAGRLDLDAPLPDRSRAHLTLELDHLASRDTASFAMREAFVDANLLDFFWVRAGKQVLQWSRCQLWTPADLVNVEAPQFQARLGAREGVTGVRVHLPVGAQFNLYGFADLRGVSKPSDIAMVGRMEFTLPHTEVGVTGRQQDGKRFIPALDFSSGYDRWQLAGEAAWLAPGTLMTVEESGNTAWIIPVDHRTPQVSLSINRPFDALGRTDRLRLGAEGFWNPEGEADNVFRPLTSMNFRRPVFLGRDTIRSGPEAALRVFGGAYRPYQLGQWYLMGYGILADAPVTSSSLKLSVLGNLSDNSWLGLVEWDWESLHGLTVGLSASTPFGAYPAEFTWTSEWLSLRADLGIRF